MSAIRISDLARPQFKANPYPLYARMRGEAAVWSTTFLGAPTWLVTRYEDVVNVLKDERFLKDWTPRTKWIHRLSGAVTRHMLNKDAPDHTRLRTLVHKAFTPSLVERLRNRIQSVCDELLEELQTNGRMDLMKGYALPLTAHHNRRVTRHSSGRAWASPCVDAKQSLSLKHHRGSAVSSRSKISYSAPTKNRSRAPSCAARRFDHSAGSGRGSGRQTE